MDLKTLNALILFIWDLFGALEPPKNQNRKTDYWRKIGPENRLLAQDWVPMIRLENRFLGLENRFLFRSLGKHTREDTPKTPGTGKPIIGTRLHRKADYIGARLDRKTDY